MGNMGGLDMRKYERIKESSEMPGTPWGNLGGFNITNLGDYLAICHISLLAK